MDNKLIMCECFLMRSISSAKVVPFAEKGKKNAVFFPHFFPLGRAAQPRHKSVQINLLFRQQGLRAAARSPCLS